MDKRRGSTLGWVILFMMTMVIFLMASLTMAASHLYRYQRYHSRRQAELTALSVAEAIAADFERTITESSMENNIRNVLVPLLEEEPSGDIRLEGLDEDMGVVVLSYEYEEDLLVMTVGVSLRGESEEAVLTMRRGSGRGALEPWGFMGYGGPQREVDQ